MFIAELRLAECSDIVLVLACTRVGDMDIGSCQRTIQLEGDVRINDGGGGNSIIHDDRIYPDSCPCQKRLSAIRQRQNQHKARTCEAESNIVARSIWIARRRIVPCTAKRHARAGCNSTVGTIRAKIPVHGVGRQYARHRVAPLVIDCPVGWPGEDDKREEKSGPPRDRRSS